MQFLTDIIFIRFMERVFIILAAAFTIRQGVLLLRDNVGNLSNVEFKALGGNLKITNAATGLVMSLFGVFILAYALFNKLEYSEGAKKPDQETLAKIKTDVDALTKKGVLTKDDLKPLSEEIAKQLKNKQTGGTAGGIQVKYDQGGTAAYKGPKIKLATVKDLFNLIKTLQTAPITIDQNQLRDLKDIYTDIYEFNKSDPSLQPYAPENLNK
jgi:hypothetical protein